MDDICDINKNKICNNCGLCLEEQGIDTKAINIEEIAKTIEENKFLEEELVKLYELDSEEKKDMASLEIEDQLTEKNNEEYIDAFDYIEYIEDLDANDEVCLEELTEEIFPGVRRMKRVNK